MDFSAIIFSDSYTEYEKENELARYRASAAIPFAGRFRMIDFPLSAFVCAGVRDVAIITNDNYGSLEAHIGSGRYWDLDHRTSQVRLLSPFSRGSRRDVHFFRGKLDALRGARDYIRNFKTEYLIISGSNMAANINFELALAQHAATDADITAVYANVPATLSVNLAVKVADDGQIVDFYYCGGKEYAKKYPNADILLGAYVMKTEFLLNFLETADIKDYYHLEKKLLMNESVNHKVIGYRHTGWAMPINTVGEYYAASMALLKSEVRCDLFNTKRPVMTRVKDTVPVSYKSNAKVENSLLGDGCVIDGMVKNSIIFREVEIEEGAEVENCIIMQYVRIRKGARLYGVVVDKHSEISSGVELKGSAEYPAVLVKGTSI